MWTTSEKPALLRTGLHLLVWILLIIFPFFLSQGESSPADYHRLIKYTLVPMVFYAIIFYLNYLLLIDTLLFRKRAWLFLLINLALITCFTWLHFEIKELINLLRDLSPPPPGSPPLPGKNKPPVQLFIYKDLISMGIPIIIAFALKINEKWSSTEAEKQEREKDILNTELQNLKYQLQPHFFFNSLNNIYALIERSPSLAQETVHSLAKLMRYLLYDTDTPRVSLSDEIGFMRQYVELMKLRLSDKAKVEADFPEVSGTYEVPPLLFISLIENAFKHGISATQNSELSFRLEVIGPMIRFSAENTNFPKSEKDKSGSGIGLINLRKRLGLIYPDRHYFHSRVEGSRYFVVLEINTSAA
jgi:hypothetical protein